MTTKTFSLLCLSLIGSACLLSIFKSLNRELFGVINQALPLKILWMTITNMGDAMFLGCILFVALHKNRHLLPNALLCALFIHYTVKLTKHLCAVLRPEHSPDLLTVTTLGPALKLDNYAMPSGHTASVFMAAIFIITAQNLRGWKLGAILACAALIGLSRIAVGAHWPADVFAGAVIGIGFGLLCTHQKLNLNHPSVPYISLVFYWPFIYLAINHVNAITDFTSLVNEGIFVTAGITALIIWLLAVKRLFSGKSV